MRAAAWSESITFCLRHSVTTRRHPARRAVAGWRSSPDRPRRITIGSFQSGEAITVFAEHGETAPATIPSRTKKNRTDTHPVTA
ncbi:MAG: hypothetical protein RL088_2252 [Verrucomicrobiota bacterium]|jgi:hypothetical protein